MSNNNYVNRYLYSVNGGKQNLDSDSFLKGELAYIGKSFEYSMDVYSKLSDILAKPYSFIIGNGGLGKSVFLDQIETNLIENEIKYERINFRSLSFEKSLIERLKPFCIKNKFESQVVLLLDSVDEGIDSGIVNISEMIKDASSTLLNLINDKPKKYKIIDNDCIAEFEPKENRKIKNRKVQYKKNIKTQVKIIITCRDNRLPDELKTYMSEIYGVNEHDKNNFVYQLCRLTEDDARNLADLWGCNDSYDFIIKVKELNLGIFASSPSTLKPLVQMYNEGKITAETNNYEIYEEAILQLCKESPYRHHKALNQEGKYKSEPIEELLFVASKLAITLKIQEINYITYDRVDNTLFVEDFYNLHFIIDGCKKIHFSKELVDFTLKTKLFCKDEKGYYFEQKTQQDFLVAYYLLQMNAKVKDYKKILTIDNKLHPRFTESLAYMALKNNWIFNKCIKEIPEDLLLSNVQFNILSNKKKIFKKYLELTKNERISFWKYNFSRVFFHKKLNYVGIKKELKIQIKNSNERIKEVILEIIEDNQISGFEKEVEKIIFNKNPHYH